ncbi:RNA polymerase sigma factor [Pedobacter sp. MW01-1-1]|uniref:RNA polymerase sigma factor n=1 Tax=Pedobacter sp. MW01-1-1 TaxID=3383027 RepID=UPI003FF1028F
MKKECWDDYQLIDRLHLDDADAFEVVFKNFKPKLYNFSWRFLRNKAQCEEVVQETFIKLWINRKKLDHNFSLAPYVFTIARRLTLNSLRNRSTASLAIEKFWKDVKYDHNETEEAVFLTDLMGCAEKAISKLPKQQQMVFSLSRNKGYSHQEIALQLNLSKNTVNNHLVEALRKLRTEFEMLDIC